MTQLSVNVNKLATLRNARGKNSPNVLEMSEKILTLGVHGITVHPRPDERHIRSSDVWEIKNLIANWKQKGAQVEFNIEGYPSPAFIDLIEKAEPDQATLVPDPPEAITSNAGWSFAQNEKFLCEVTSRLAQCTRVSLFLEPSKFDSVELNSLKVINPARIELYTEAYADSFGTPQADQVLAVYKACASTVRDLGIGVNAGHDLNQQNLNALVRGIPWIAEVSIGHALFCEAIEQGLSHTIRNYQAILART